jgi:YebC/PmpR family DNA-binding regulatory protein
MSGHSKWATIKRAKGATDAKRGQLFTKLAREITVAARAGLPDPEANARLRIAVLKARAENMPKDNIDRAIERAKGGAGGESLDEILYEGYGPGGIAFMIQAMTDNRNRTVGEVRAAFTRGGGNLGADGAVAWMFDSVGQIVANPGKMDPEEAALLAIDAGALEFEVEDDAVIIYTEQQDLHKVQEQLAESGLEIESSDLIMKPKDPVTPEPELAVKVIRLVERLEDLDDVQTVYTNMNLTDDVLAQVS